jgi:hypothetical protein
MLIPHNLKLESVCARPKDPRVVLREPFFDKADGKTAYLVGLDGKMLLAVPIDSDSCEADERGYIPAWALKEARKMREPFIEAKGDEVKAGTMSGKRNPNGYEFPSWRSVVPPERPEKKLRIDVNRLAALAKSFDADVVTLHFQETKDGDEILEVMRVEIPGAPDGTIALLMPALNR